MILICKLILTIPWITNMARLRALGRQDKLTAGDITQVKNNNIVYKARAEESLTLNLTLDKAFYKIRNPYGLKEELIARINDMMADRTGLKTAAFRYRRFYYPTWPENN
jgi:hypothetical protein